jgi:hypothetical protein
MDEHSIRQIVQEEFEIDKAAAVTTAQIKTWSDFEENELDWSEVEKQDLTYLP